jgi:hypothetical protein
MFIGMLAAQVRPLAGCVDFLLLLAPMIISMLLLFGLFAFSLEFY